jgi:CDP-6-deoxy-D-xylo-4-hexulose-3-dehydrase
MQGRNFRVSGATPNADLVMRSTFWIGVYPGLAQAQLDYVLGQFDQFFHAAA